MDTKIEIQEEEKDKNPPIIGDEVNLYYDTDKSIEKRIDSFFDISQFKELGAL